MAFYLYLFIFIFVDYDMSTAMESLDMSLILAWNYNCPDIDTMIYKGCGPRANQGAGVYEKVNGATQRIEDCVAGCCNNKTCNAVFLYKTTCYEIFCKSDAACEPTKRKTTDFEKNAQMALVRPFSTSYITDMEYKPRTCEYGLDIDCPLNEECVTNQMSRSRNGMCTCKDQFERDEDGMCVPIKDSLQAAKSGHSYRVISQPDDTDTQTQTISEPATSTTPSTTTLGQLVVKVNPKEIQLPENEAILSVFTIPEETEGSRFEYDWKIISRPEGEKGIMQDQNTKKLKLSELVEGLYSFKVTVNTPIAMGEAYVNVTVLPPKRNNKPPVAKVNPQNQVVTLPNNNAVLDASSSTDDSKIINYHWELQQGPMGYQPTLEDTPLLQLQNLIVGNYTFKLTVEDSDHATNSTTASINVTKEPDYPPTANAGQTIIVYLPQTTVTLNGNLSNDDKGIASWEWTMTLSDNERAVDMQNTHTPYLELSNLELGVYTFMLKVTDTAGQTATNDVHVFVKEPPNKPPEVSVGPDTTINLPQTWVMLDGSESKDEVKIVLWKWEQVSGPNQASIINPDKSKTNVTGLTKGEYKFKLSVTNQNKINISAIVGVTVIQSDNQPPKANAGGEQVIILPISVLVVNGSKSTDDAGIVQWEWTRESSSLAAGRVVGDSDKKSQLMVTGLIPGTYTFSLKVTDEQGVSNSDSATIHVKPNPLLMDLVQMELNTNLATLTEVDKNTVLQQLALLLHEEGETKVVLDELNQDDTTGHAKLIFHVEKLISKSKTDIMSGSQVLQQLKDKLHHDEGLLLFPALTVDTVICQNECSQHGSCDQQSRECLCEAFWMENVIRRHLGDGERNCDWSILYVIIVVFLLVIMLIGFMWSCVCVCQRWCGTPKPKKKHRYSLLDDNEMETLSQSNLMNSDTDSESDVLYESRKQISRSNSKPKGKNGFVSFNKRIKT